MIICQLINETHYDFDNNKNANCFKLRFVKKTLNEKRVKFDKKNNDFYFLKRFLKHCFQIRVVVVLIAMLKKRNLTKNLQKIKNKLHEMTIANFKH